MRAAAGGGRGCLAAAHRGRLSVQSPVWDAALISAHQWLRDLGLSRVSSCALPQTCCPGGIEGISCCRTEIGALSRGWGGVRGQKSISTLLHDNHTFVPVRAQGLRLRARICLAGPHNLDSLALNRRQRIPAREQQNFNGTVEELQQPSPPRRAQPCSVPTPPSQALCWRLRGALPAGLPSWL